MIQEAGLDASQFAEVQRLDLLLLPAGGRLQAVLHLWQPLGVQALLRRCSRRSPHVQGAALKWQDLDLGSKRGDGGCTLESDGIVLAAERPAGSAALDRHGGRRIQEDEAGRVVGVEVLDGGVGDGGQGIEGEYALDGRGRQHPAEVEGAAAGADILADIDEEGQGMGRRRLA
jgi:hypothetical protein